jgi:Tfp pilus tip-associated adhesin PilY1
MVKILDLLTNDPTISYENYSEVKAAGKAPIRIGDPGYSTKLDRDGDGIACEN